jgi:hypothetical protein
MSAKSLVLIPGLVIAFASGASAIEVPRGEWTIEMKIDNPMLADAMNQTHTECIDKENWTPEELMEDPSCRIYDKADTAKTISWKMDCTQEGMASHGEASFTVDGETITGGMTITMTAGGRTMSMRTTMHGKRTAKTCQRQNKNR